MTTKSTVSHKGIVTRISDSAITVSILSQSACAACHAKGACTMADMQEKEVSIPVKGAPVVKTGQTVEVILDEHLGAWAVFWGYGFPFILMLTAFILVFSFTGHELLAGLSALGVLLPAYLILYLLRSRLARTFVFRLSPLSGEGVQYPYCMIEGADD